MSKRFLRSICSDYIIPLAIVIGIKFFSKPFYVSPTQVDTKRVQSVVNILPTATPFQTLPDFKNMTYEQAIRCVKTPPQAQDYVNWTYFRDSKFKGIENYSKFKRIENLINGYSFRRTHEGSCPVECRGRAIAIAALLSDDGYPPLVLDLDWKEDYGHWVFIYKEGGKLGSVGNQCDFREPTYENVRDLARDLASSYGFSVKSYGVYDLSECYSDWIEREKPMKFIPQNIRF